MALLRAFRAALDELGVAGKTVAADMTSASPAFQAVDAGETVPAARRRAYVPRLLEIVEKHRIGLLVPTTDTDLPVLARHRGRFAALGCTVMVGAERDIRICRDKARTGRLLARAGVESIRTVSLREFRARPFYPCFVKPTHGSGSIGARAIGSQAELRAHVATFGRDVVVQDLAGGQEFTIDAYRDRQGRVRCVVPRQRLAVRAGEVINGVTVNDRELIDATVKLSAGLRGLWGVYCCQCRRLPGGPPRFFEVNPRFGGGAPLSIAAGANLPLYLLQEVLGLPITARLGEFTDRLLMLRYDDAIFVPIDDPATLPGYDRPSFR